MEAQLTNYLPFQNAIIAFVKSSNPLYKGRFYLISFQTVVIKKYTQPAKTILRLFSYNFFHIYIKSSDIGRWYLHSDASLFIIRLWLLDATIPPKIVINY